MRALRGGTPLPGFPHEEREHGFLGRGGGCSDDVNGKCEGVAPLALSQRK